MPRVLLTACQFSNESIVAMRGRVAEWWRVPDAKRPREEAKVGNREVAR